MIKDKINNFKSLILKNSEGNNKKKIENLVVFIVLLIITIIVINMILNDDNKETKQINSIDSIVLASTDSKENVNDSIEGKLENILSEIEGVGKVKVLITYSEQSSVIPMYNEDISNSNTEEVDKSGGNRKISQNSSKKEVIYKEVNGEKIPVTQSVIQPKAEGAIITAQGASNINVKSSIIQAVEAVSGLPTHKIQVFEMKR